MRWHPNPRWGIAVLGCVAVIAAGCSSSGGDGASDTTDAPDAARTITDEEASVLADILVKNQEAGGAKVRVAVPYGAATFTLDGEVDWANDVGSVLFHADVEGAEAPEDRRVAFNADVVLEEVPGLADRLGQQGATPVNWVARPLQSTDSPLDVVLTLIIAASSTARENPVLLVQDDTQWLGTDTLSTEEGEIDVDVFSSGKVRYFVDDEGRLVRQEADLTVTSSTVTLDFWDRGPRTVGVPADDDVVAIEDVQDLYDELVSG